MLKQIALVSILAALTLGSANAQANCLKKAAVATAGDEKSAKWFALETMVQTVSWGIWPAFVADGSTPGYRIARQRYKCKRSGAVVTCNGQATFCPTKK